MSDFWNITYYENSLIIQLESATVKTTLKQAIRAILGKQNSETKLEQQFRTENWISNITTCKGTTLRSLR